MTMAARKTTKKQNPGKDPFGAFGEPTAPEAPPKPKRKKAKAQAKKPSKAEAAQQHSAAAAPSAGADAPSTIWPADGPKPRPAEPTPARGRPTTYTPELADRICFELAQGKSLNEICLADDMPAESTVRGWALDDREGFAAKYARARELQAWRWADEIVEIGDDGRNDWMERFNAEGESIGWALNGEHVQRSKLRSETRKWLLSKMLPKTFGDKLELTGEALTKMPAADLESKFNTLLAAVEKRQAAAQPKSGET